MKPGDIVKHKLSGEVYRILKVHESMTVCQCPPYSHKLGWSWQEWTRYICAAENLELYPDGKVIFDWLDSFGENQYTRLLKQAEPIKPGTQLSLI
jgi:hypothetical protein